MCLHFVQAYIEGIPAPGSIQNASNASKHTAEVANPRKRKAPGSEAVARDNVSKLGLLTPVPSHLSDSRSPSLSSADDAFQVNSVHNWWDIQVYNGILQRREGWIIAKKVVCRSRMDRDTVLTVRQGTRFEPATVNTARLPTQEMLKHASITPGPVAAAESLIRQAFMEKLQAVPGVYLKNNIDRTTPSLDFDFIDEFVLGAGVTRADPETNLGCEAPCRPNMGGFCGCEYTKKCSCLEYAAVDEERLKAEDDAAYAKYQREVKAGGFVDTTGLPKRFPYSKSKHPNVPSTLRLFYREQRHPIYECNENCNCGEVCKSRLVQKGRRVPLTIFKTANRGWGVYCNEDLVLGEFIDTYPGEVLTNEKTKKREERGGINKASYLFSLDKFVDDDESLTRENCYVVDGEYKGGPTRFINHSCEPNCRMYTVSYNKNDLRVYDLAFFAYDNIKAGTELTFDYMDLDELEVEDAVRKREEARLNPKNAGVTPCNCGAVKCRGYLWGASTDDET